MIIKVQYNGKQRRIEVPIEKMVDSFGLVVWIAVPLALWKIYDLIKPFLDK